MRAGFPFLPFFAIMQERQANMPKRKTDKKITFLEPDFSEVLVCRNKKLKTHVEIAIEKPENVSLENLGTILGIFEITDESEDSSYIISYLISVIKKEYFSKPKRGPIESLEAALNKANLALSKLAEHENINWIGQFNAICAVFEKGNLYFSKTGESSVLLLRSHTFTDIGREITPADAANPLKTFVDIVSGKLEEGDKVILATNEIFDIFSAEEIKRSALKFSSIEFVQFLQTALVNELERAAVLVADVNLKEKEEPVYTPAPTEFNAFSQSAFEKKTRPEPEEKSEITQELKDILSQENGDFIDKKTGHIYIKEDSYRYSAGDSGSFFSSFHGKIVVATSFLKPSRFFSFLTWPFRKWQERKTEKVETVPVKTIEELEPEIAAEMAKMENNNPAKPKKQFLKTILNALAYFFQGLRDVFIFSFRIIRIIAIKIKNIWMRLSRQQKIYATIIILALIAIPYIIITSKKPAEIARETIQESVPPAPNYDEMRGDAKEIANLAEIYSAPDSDILQTFILKDRVLAVKSKEIVDVQSQEAFPLPDNFQNPKLIAKMDDLQLIFLLNNENKLTAFSPVSKNFQDNAFAIPDGAEIKILGTYLTYLYVVDGKNNQIYRYPRATGGFGDKADWLKDSANLGNTSGIAISENLYVGNGKEIQKFFRGKKQNFSIKNPENKTIIPDEIYTIGGNDNLFVLDKENMLVLKLDKDGNILAKFFSPQIKDAVSFAVSEQENKVILSTKNKVLAGDLE